MRTAELLAVREVILVQPTSPLSDPLPDARDGGLHYSATAP
jgi:hypothetical protein